MRAENGARRQFLLGAVTVLIIIVGVALIVAALVPGSGGGIFSHADDQSDTNQPRIVVNGYGQASAPADSASIQLLVQNMSGGYGGSGRDYGTPGPGIAGSVQVAAAVPIVDALVSAGVARDDIDVVASPSFSSGACYAQNCQGPFRIDITVDQPSLDRVTKVINQAAQAANDNELRVTDVGASYTMADCSTLERQARQTAIQDAQKEAAQQAQLLHVRLNTMVEVSDASDDAGTSSSSSCSGPVNATTSGSSSQSRSTNAMTVPDFDPKTPTNAVAEVTVKLTYSILSGS